LGKSAKCPYCGALNDIVDLSNDDDELAALIEEERKKVGGSKAASAFSDPLRTPGGGGNRATPQKSQNWRQAPSAKKADLETGMFDLALGQMLAIAVIVLGTGELIASVTMASQDHFANALFGICGWFLGAGAWREYQVRKRNPAAIQLWENLEFWVAVAAAVLLALWATLSFAAPAFPVLTGGSPQGFNSRVMGYLAKVFLLWFALLGCSIALFVMGTRHKFFTAASWGYVSLCMALLIFFTPFSEGVGSLRGYADRGQQVLLAAIPQNPASAGNVNPGGANPGNTNPGSANPGNAIAGSTTPAPSPNPQPNQPEANPPPNTAGTNPAAAPENTAQQPEPNAPGGAAPDQPAAKALPQVAWQAAADPDAHAETRPWIRQPAILFPSSTDLAWPTSISPLMAVLNRNQTEPSAQLWDLSTACNKGIIRGSFDFKDSILLSRDGKYLAGSGDFGTEVWSFETGKLLARLPLDKHVGEVFVDFLPDQSILMLGNTPKAGQYKIWSFGSDPTARKVDLPDGVTIDVHAAAVSPGRRFLATFSQGYVWIVDLQKGELCGMLQVSKPEEAQAGNSEAHLCFSPNGLEIAGIFGSSQTPRLMAWSMSDGSPTANFDLSEPISNGLDKGRVLECFPDNQGWLVDDRAVMDRSGQEWPIKRQDLRILGLSDNDHLIVANEQMLSTWKLARQSDGRLKLATLEIQHEELPPVMFSRDAGTALSGDAFNRASRRYRSQVEIDILAAEDSALLQTLRWSPALKQPFLGVRWGTGILTQMPAAAGSASTSLTGRVEDQTGALGTAIVGELQRRLDAGAFGQEPQVGDPRLNSVIFLGSGTKNELLNTAKAMGLSAVVLFQIPQQLPGVAKRPDDQIKIHVMDVTGKVQWEHPAPNTAPGATAAEIDPEEIANVAADVGKYLDDNYVLQPMPEMQAKDLPARIKRMGTEAHDDLLTVFAEVRYDQLKGLLTAEEATAAFRTWLSDERAQVMASGTPAQRRALLEQWLKTTKS
jgi:hypothetical protein